MKVTVTPFTKSRCYENDKCTVTISPSKEIVPYVVFTVGKFEAAAVEITRTEAARILKKMR